MENEATVSKNFIEQIIEKDLAEGHCKTVTVSYTHLDVYKRQECGLRCFTLHGASHIRLWIFRFGL